MTEPSRASAPASGTAGRDCSIPRDAYAIVIHEGSAESRLSPGNTMESRNDTGSWPNDGVQQLPPLLLRRDPCPRLLRPHLARMRSRIPPALAEAMRDCTSGAMPWPLFCYGRAGAGKTSAALYLCDRVMGTVLFRDYAPLCEELADVKMGRLEWGISKVTAADWWGRWVSRALCVVDEVGLRDQVTDHQYETLQRAIDIRYGKPLMVVSNLDIAGIARVFDDRVASRLGGGTVVRVEGQDQRQVDFIMLGAGQES